jgi:16S rRNA (cytosine1402-N4)-methyltransferase
MDKMHQTHFHIPILLHETVTLLLTDLSGIYVDGTLGGGGHSSEILGRLYKSGRIVGIDRDSDAVMHCRKKFTNSNHIHIVQGDIENIDRILDDLNIKQINGYLLDLGLSSHQIDSQERGFSYLTNGPLDMRMDVSLPVSARDIVNQYTEKDLADMFYHYGEERHSRRIARKIVEIRQKEDIRTTHDMAEVIRKITPFRFQVKTLARIWQSIRVEVNDEIKQLESSLKKVVPYLKPGGRIVVLSYESITDRIVKQFFRGPDMTYLAGRPLPTIPDKVFRVLTRKIVRPDEEEIRNNPRARSARLRAAEKLD